ncbi:MAG: C4-type zinc ribbon domain-containing protein [Bacteroidota bacterium]
MAKTPPKSTSAKSAATKVDALDKKAKNTDISAEEVEVAKKTVKSQSDDKAEISIEKKLVALYQLQQIDTEINKIHIVRGELPLEVQDLEDEIEGLDVRLENYKKETETLETSIKEKKTAIKDFQTAIKKYETQQMSVRNNREYDSVTKEIEFQTLEIQLCEKKIREFTTALDAKKETIDKTKVALKERTDDLKQKKAELDDIVNETEKEENKLLKKSLDNQKYVEDRLLTAYQKIKQNVRNGLAVVVVERDACGGCFNKIPPQRQLDIQMHKKIIVCEYCGRILVDISIAELAQE